MNNSNQYSRTPQKNFTKYQEIKPPKKRFKVMVVKTFFFVLSRSLQKASKFDKNIKMELAEYWPEGSSFMFKVLPNGPTMTLVKEKGRLKRCKIPEEKVNLILFFKNIDITYLTMTARMGTVQAFAEHRSSVKGDIGQALSLVRILTIVQTYLFPRIIARRVIRKLPKIKWYHRYWGRLRIYLFGVPLGI